MIIDEIRESLFHLSDETYRAFQGKLIPTVPPKTFIGVRTPELRKLARQLAKRPDIGEFLEDLPHRYFDENQLHAFIISDIRDYEACIRAVERFLPFVDNWATCDQMSPKVFKKHRPALLERIKGWLGSDHTYTVRFAIGILMTHFLDDDFNDSCLEMVSGVRSEEYYVRMMVAWYFATALTKQYEAALPYIENRSLDPWTHNKAIQKARESYRVPDDRKAYLKSLKW